MRISNISIDIYAMLQLPDEFKCATRHAGPTSTALADRAAPPTPAGPARLRRQLRRRRRHIRACWARPGRAHLSAETGRRVGAARGGSACLSTASARPGQWPDWIKSESQRRRSAACEAAETNGAGPARPARPVARRLSARPGSCSYHAPIPRRSRPHAAPAASARH